METGLFAKTGLVLAIPALVLSLIVNPSVAGAQNSTSTDSTVRSDVLTEELCTWHLQNVPASISLEPETAGDEYDGTAMSLSADRTNFNINSSGASTVAINRFADCTFYGSPTKPTVSIAINRTSFEAAAETGGNDDEMDIDLSSDGFDVSFTAETCDGTDWTTNNLSLTPTSAASLISLTGAVDSPLTQSGTQTQRCIGTLGFEVQIPAGKTPTYPGQDYVFTGPDITFSAAFNPVN